MNFLKRFKNAGNDKKRLVDNFLSLGALQIVTYVIPLITLPYLSRVLGVEKFGLVFFAYAFGQYFNILTDFGFNLSAVKEIAVNRDKPEKISEIYSAVMIIKAGLLALSFLIMAIAVVSIEKLRHDWIIYLYTYIMVIGNALYPVWFFQGIERMKYITFLNITARLIFLILTFIFIKTSADYTLVPLLTSLGFLVAGLLGLFIAVKQFKVKVYFADFKAIKIQFKNSSEFFLSRVSASLYTNTNAFFLGIIGSNVMVGYYVAAEKIYQALNGICFPITNALYPYVAKHKDIDFYKKIFYLVTVANILVCTFVFVFAKELIVLFYGAQMLGAINVLKIFAVVVLFATPGVMLGYPFLAALNHSKEANMSIVLGSIIHLIGLGSLYFSGIMSIYTIALMVFMTEFCVFAIRVYSVKKYNLWNPKNKSENRRFIDENEALDVVAEML